MSESDFQSMLNRQKVQLLPRKEAALSQIPIWLIHGIDDTENPITSDEQLYKEIGGSKNILFWKLKGITHNTVFTTTILGNTLPEWLFKQCKK